MWRRVSAQLQTVAPWRSSVLGRCNGGDSLRNRALASASSFLHSSSPVPSPFQKTPPLFSHQATSDAENIMSKGKKRVEDIIPISTGHEREELEAELEGRKRFAMDPPGGLSVPKSCLQTMSFSGHRATISYSSAKASQNIDSPSEPFSVSLHD